MTEAKQPSLLRHVTETLGGRTRTTQKSTEFVFRREVEAAADRVKGLKNFNTAAVLQLALAGSRSPNP
jgi:hypothetical protein